MTPHEQTDLFGQSIPLEQLELSGNLRLLADAERQLSSPLTFQEAGGILHEHRGRHPRDESCEFCVQDGFDALTRLRAKTAAPGVASVPDTSGASGEGNEPGPRAAAPPWTCVDCGHENPAGAIFCRGCASTQDDDREPKLAGRPRDDREAI